MKRNQDTYFAIVREAEPVSAYCPAVGTFRGGPTGTSKAPHLYLSEAKAKARCGPDWKVVPVKLVVAGDSQTYADFTLEELEDLVKQSEEREEGFDFMLGDEAIACAIIKALIARVKA
ncbi:hypothetical protein [Burkholderia vietnamiensis]|uniref:hypothetical protein n=1 Tax=Burkholderia vietnamiensis TaxID=60552 RepID=UPI0026502507|nr:hypothetical protein [Burkholderia vietnamiensis]MDN8037428.1 hypothetical protein [Burkholderia vietnamiensis]